MISARSLKVIRRTRRLRDNNDIGEFEAYLDPAKFPTIRVYEDAGGAQYVAERRESPDEPIYIRLMQVDGVWTVRGCHSGPMVSLKDDLLGCVGANYVTDDVTVDEYCRRDHFSWGSTPMRSFPGDREKERRKLHKANERPVW